MATIPGGNKLSEPSVVRDPEDAGLATGVLSNFQVMAEAVGMIGPSLGAAALIPLAFSAAGGGTWLTVLIATLGMLAVGVIVSELARRHVSIGALYTLIPKGLGPSGGLLAAGAFGLAALAGQMISILGFGAAFAQFLSSAFSIGHSSRAELVVLDLGGLLLATVVTLRGVNLSTKILLVCEGAAMAAISILLIIVLVKHGHIIDSSQLSLHGASVHGIVVGMTFLVLAFGGFEGAATLGVEAKNPGSAVRLALIGSVVVVGIFFVVNAYIQILGFEGTGLQIADQAVPLGALASHYGVGGLGDIVLLGVTLSWFGVLCAWANYAPRPTLAMADEGVLPKWLRRTDPKTGTPLAALMFWTITWLAITIYLIVANVNLSGALSNIGVLAGYAYTMLYLLLALAALSYAYRRGLRKSWFIGAAVVAGAVMVIEYWYSFNPLPAHPLNIYVYGFAIFVALLIVGCGVAWVAAPGWLRRMGSQEEADA